MAAGPLLGDPEGDKRSATEVEADEIGPSLKLATAKPQRTRELAAATHCEVFTVEVTLAGSEAAAHGAEFLSP
jgi:hypothetical protein